MSNLMRFDIPGWYWIYFDEYIKMGLLYWTLM